MLAIESLPTLHVESSRYHNIDPSGRKQKFTASREKVHRQHVGTGSATARKDVRHVAHIFCQGTLPEEEVLNDEIDAQ